MLETHFIGKDKYRFRVLEIDKPCKETESDEDYNMLIKESVSRMHINYKYIYSPMSYKIHKANTHRPNSRNSLQY